MLQKLSGGSKDKLDDFEKSGIYEIKYYIIVVLRLYFYANDG